MRQCQPWARPTRDDHAPEVLGGQLLAEQHRRVLPDSLLDDPAALLNARYDLEHAVPPRDDVGLAAGGIQEAYHGDVEGARPLHDGHTGRRRDREILQRGRGAAAALHLRRSQVHRRVRAPAGRRILLREQISHITGRIMLCTITSMCQVTAIACCTLPFTYLSAALAQSYYIKSDALLVHERRLIPLSAFEFGETVSPIRDSGMRSASLVVEYSLSHAKLARLNDASSKTSFTHPEPPRITAWHPSTP